MIDQFKVGKQFPKNTPLPGSVHLEWHRCGRPNCHCRSGELHSPNAVRRWRDGRRRRQALTIVAEVNELRMSDYLFPGQKPGRPLSVTAFDMLMHAHRSRLPLFFPRLGR